MQLASTETYGMGVNPNICWIVSFVLILKDSQPTDTYVYNKETQYLHFFVIYIMNV